MKALAMENFESILNLLVNFSPCYAQKFLKVASSAQRVTPDASDCYLTSKGDEACSSGGGSTGGLSRLKCDGTDKEVIVC